MPSIVFRHFFLLGVFWSSWICGLILNINLGEILSHSCFKYFFLFLVLSSPSGILIMFVSHPLWLSLNPWIFYSVVFFFLISLCCLCFWVLRMLLIYPLAQRFFPQTCLLMNPSEAFFFSVTVLFTSSISFPFFLRISISLLILSMFLYAVYFIH